MKMIRTFLIAAIAAQLIRAAEPGMMTTHHASSDFDLSADPDSSQWKVSGVIADKDALGKLLPEARTEIRSRWTSKNLYFLFIGKYESLYSRPNPDPQKEAWGLWEYDVAEVFIGNDLKNIHLYKEFEVSPDGEFIDLDVDKLRKGKEVDWLWNSEFRYKTKIDREKKIWICEMQIPWSSIDPRNPKIGNELRLNLYRIEGAPPNRKYIAWQTVGNPSFHTPEKFGRLILR